jgi:hypothetical protein
MKIYALEQFKQSVRPYTALNTDQNTAEHLRKLYHSASRKQEISVKSDIDRPVVFVDPDREAHKSSLIPDIDQVARQDCLIFSERAQRILTPHFTKFGEFMDVTFDEKYSIYYCNKFLDPFVLSETYATNGYSTIIEIHSFIEEKIRGIDVFKSIFDYDRLYFSEDAKKAIEINNLRNNLEFNLVWDSQDAEFIDETWGSLKQWNRIKELKDTISRRLDSI